MDVVLARAEGRADNAAAREGLTKVADDLVQRGETALDQGRFDDARAAVERIRSALPDHEGAKALAQKIFPEAAAVRRLAPRCRCRSPKSRASRASRRRRRPPPKPQVDPVVEASAAFDKALAEGRLLTPTEQSAKHYVGVLNRLNVDHDLTKGARTALSLEFLSRAAQSIEALDPEAAGIWIDEAEALLGAADEGVRKARSALTEQLIAMESAKPVPASALKLATYVAPAYPRAPASGTSKAGSISSSRSAPTARRATSSSPTRRTRRSSAAKRRRPSPSGSSSRASSWAAPSSRRPLRASASSCKRILFFRAFCPVAARLGARRGVESIRHNASRSYRGARRVGLNSFLKSLEEDCGETPCACRTSSPHRCSARRLRHCACAVPVRLHERSRYV